MIEQNTNISGRKELSGPALAALAVIGRLDDADRTAVLGVQGLALGPRLWRAADGGDLPTLIRSMSTVSAHGAGPLAAPPIGGRQAGPGAPRGTVTLTALLSRAGAAVRAGLPEPVWVSATVSAAKAARGGHGLELVDAEACGGAHLRAYLPDGVVAALGRASGAGADPILLVGLTIVLRLCLDLHPRWGLSARVSALAPGTEASLAVRALAAARDRLCAAGLLDRQRRLPVPRDVTRLAVVHPPGAAGWADVAGEIRRWQDAGVLVFRSVSVPFEGAGASTGLAGAVERAAAESIAGAAPDLVLIVRGGGARAGLAPLDDEVLARAIALSPMPVVTGLGHATDRSLADEVAWRAADTPSKALGVVRELVARPARRARDDHAAAVAVVLSGLDRAGPGLDAARRGTVVAAQSCAVAAGDRLEIAWACVVGSARAERERLGRQGDALDTLVTTAASAGSIRLDRCGTGLAAQLEAVNERGRAVLSDAPDGGRLLAAAMARVGAGLDAAEAAARVARREAALAGRMRVERLVTDIAVLGEAVRARARDRIGSADDGGRHLATIVGTAGAIVVGRQTECEHLIEAVEAIAAHWLDAAAVALAGARAVLDGADPARVLARGYALAFDGASRPVTSAHAARAEHTLTLRFADGDVAVRVIPH